MKVVLLLAALLAGMLAPLQAGLNIRMGRAIGNPFYAAFISFFVGTLTLLVYVLCSDIQVASIKKGLSLPWPVWCAGMLGVVFVTATIILPQKIGATLTFSLVVAGQLILALAMDHFGLLEVPVHALSWPRVAGVMLILAGVVLIRRF